VYISANEEKPMPSESRPDGIPGLLIDEIQLTGIFRTTKGYVAQVKSGIRSYLLKQGDQLFDGDVVSISRGEIVFKQAIQNPSGQKPFREVVLTLNPS
jgi:Tfp pilus assembly protein PilP